MDGWYSSPYVYSWRVVLDESGRRRFAACAAQRRAEGPTGCHVGGGPEAAGHPPLGARSARRCVHGLVFKMNFAFPGCLCLLFLKYIMCLSRIPVLLLGRCAEVWPARPGVVRCGGIQCEAKVRIARCFSVKAFQEFRLSSFCSLHVLTKLIRLMPFVHVSSCFGKLNVHQP